MSNGRTDLPGSHRSFIIRYRRGSTQGSDTRGSQKLLSKTLTGPHSYLEIPYLDIYDGDYGSDAVVARIRDTGDDGDVGDGKGGDSGGVRDRCPSGGLLGHAA